LPLSLCFPNFPNWYTFAALKADGSIAVRGSSNRGGEGAPSGNDYTKIYSNWTAFVALLRFIQIESKSPHAVIEPSALRATKAVQFE
jgi:hypothetical protein